jgi:hypothetical protein
MKNLLTISLLISFFNCSSQTVVPLNAEIPANVSISNYYFKDLDNVLNKFEGTWKYQNGNTSFTVKFVKKQKVKVTDYYTDELCGWYQYIEDGVEIVNTLPFTDNLRYITGSSVSADGTKIYRMFFEDPERPKASYFLTIKYNNNGMGNPPTIEWDVKLVGVSYKMEGEPNHLTSLRVPAIITLTQQ